MNLKNPQFEDEALKINDLFLVKPYYQGDGIYGAKVLLYVNGNTSTRFYINDIYLIQGIPVVIRNCEKNNNRNIFDEYLTVEVVITSGDPTVKFELKDPSDIRLYKLISRRPDIVQMSDQTSPIIIRP